MTLLIKSLEEIATDYDAIVFDQWGVLHNGTSAYAGATEVIETLAERGCLLIFERWPQVQRAAIKVKKPGAVPQARFAAVGVVRYNPLHSSNP